jgi:uncharacterized protein YceH (UPF0502 family)
MSTDTQSTEPITVPRWCPLGAIERRVLGVLIEKAKTTPENYPLSLNALRTGSNQKSNRAPLMSLEEDQVAEALENLRKVGAVAEIQGGARIDKYRHLAYDWLGVDKVELAVMAELLLRGSQTVGELRGRAARMEPIKDLGQLQPILDSLLAKRLLVRLTPAGRGSIVTHALYTDREMEKVRREATTILGDDSADDFSIATPNLPVGQSREMPLSSRIPAVAHSAESVAQHMPLESSIIADDLRKLREELAAIRRDFQAARAEFESTAQQLRRELDDLNRQLGN